MVPRKTPPSQTISQGSIDLGWVLNLKMYTCQLLLCFGFSEPHNRLQWFIFDLPTDNIIECLGARSSNYHEQTASTKLVIDSFLPKHGNIPAPQENTQRYQQQHPQFPQLELFLLFSRIGLYLALSTRTSARTAHVRFTKLQQHNETGIRQTGQAVLKAGCSVFSNVWFMITTSRIVDLSIRQSRSAA